MFDRFTDRARRVMGFSRLAAQDFNHDYIGTEHILLALLAEGGGVAAGALRSLEVDPGVVRTATEKLMPLGTAMVTMGQIPFTPRARMALECSLEEANALDHGYIGTEHLLLGLIREVEGTAGRVLRDLGLRLEDVREKVLEVLAAEASGAAPRSVLVIGSANALSSGTRVALGQALSTLGCEDVQDAVVDRDPGELLLRIQQFGIVIALVADAPPALVRVLVAARALCRRVLLLTEPGRELPAALDAFRRVEVPGGAPLPALVERLVHELERMH